MGKAESSTGAGLRALAFFLPQFHPIPENDAWWGKGFTEWTNVVSSRPRFRGHYQPHLPGELGFYDLRLPQVRMQQAELAREHGLGGFCYYHYWFGGRRLLHEPLDAVLESGEPDFPFCLCWANENWTRNWDGREHEILVRQRHGEDDDRQHIRWLLPVLKDPRYVRVENRPLLLIYRASLLPDARRTTETWREEARREGLGELHLCRVESFPEDRGDPTELGFDAAVEFQPDWTGLGHRIRSRSSSRQRVYDYGKVAERMLARPDPGYRRYPCVTPGWDNSPRRATRAIVLHGSTPALYHRWLSEIVRRQHERCESEGLVFVNAWNEWGEGCHLEPDRRHGRAYLEATRCALSGQAPEPAAVSLARPPIVRRLRRGINALLEELRT